MTKKEIDRKITIALIIAVVLCIIGFIYIVVVTSPANTNDLSSSTTIITPGN